jgi:hypothetical protein
MQIGMMMNLIADFGSINDQNLKTFAVMLMIGLDPSSDVIFQVCLVPQNITECG